MSLSVSAAWDETAALARREGWRLFGLAFLFMCLPLTLLEMLAPVRTTGTIPLLWLAGVPLMICLSLFGALAITHIALTPGAGVAGAFRHALRRLPPLLVAALLVAIALVVLTLPLLPMIGLAGHHSDDILLRLWLILLAFAWLLFVLFFWVRLLLLTPVAATERLGSLALLERSWRLTRGHFRRLLGVIVVVSVVSLVALVAVESVGGVLVALIGGPEPGVLTMTPVLLVSELVQAAITGLCTVFVARLYAHLAGAG